MSSSSAIPVAASVIIFILALASAAHKKDDPEAELREWFRELSSDLQHRHRRRQPVFGEDLEEAASVVDRLVKEVRMRSRSDDVTEEDDLIERIAADSKVKSYLDLADERIGQLVEGFSKRVGGHLLGKERQERNVETAYHAEEDLDNGGGSGGEELLRRLDSLFRGVLTKRFGRKVSKAFFIHVFPLVEEFLKEEEGELRSSAQDRQDRYQGGAEYLARPAGGGAEGNARPVYGGGAEGNARPVYGGGAEGNARPVHGGGAEGNARPIYGGGGAEYYARSRGGGSRRTFKDASAADWLDVLRKLMF